MKPTSRLSIERVDSSSIVVVGVIDSHTADELADELASPEPDTHICVDVSGVDFIDSSGLRVVVTAHQEIEAAGGKLVLTNVSSTVERLLEITGLDSHLHTA